MLNGLRKEAAEMSLSLNGQRPEIMDSLHNAYKDQVEKLSIQNLSLPTEEGTEKLLSQLDPDIQAILIEFFAPYLPFVIQSLEAQRLVVRWGDREIISPPDFVETDRDHVLELLLLAQQIRKDLLELFTQEEWREVFTLILIHDLPEVFGGDISRKDKLHKDSSPYRHLREVAALRIMLREFRTTSSEHEQLAHQILQLFVCYQTKSKFDIVPHEGSPYKISRFVHWLDVYQGNQVALEHYDNLKQSHRSIDDETEMCGKITDIALDPLTKRTKKFTRHLEELDQIDYFATLVLDQLRDYSEAGYHQQVSNQKMTFTR